MSVQSPPRRATEGCHMRAVPARGLPDDVRRAGEGHRRGARRRGVTDSRVADRETSHVDRQEQVCREPTARQGLADGRQLPWSCDRGLGTAAWHDAGDRCRGFGECGQERGGGGRVGWFAVGRRIDVLVRSGQFARHDVFCAVGAQGQARGWSPRPGRRRPAPASRPCRRRCSRSGVRTLPRHTSTGGGGGTGRSRRSRWRRAAWRACARAGWTAGTADRRAGGAGGRRLVRVRCRRSGR